MKKILAVLLLSLAATSAMAQHYRWHHRHHGPHFYHNGSWVTPLIVGGVVGAVIANNRQTSQTETIIVQQPQTVYVQQENCTAWKEVITSEGNVYRERTCTK